MIKVVFLLVFVIKVFGLEFFYEFGKKVEVTPINIEQKRDVKFLDDISIYQTKDGKILKFKKEILTKLKDSVEADSFFRGLGIDNFLKISDNTFLIKLHHDKDIFKTLKKLYDSNKTLYAIPNRLKKSKKR